LAAFADSSAARRRLVGAQGLRFLFVEADLRRVLAELIVEAPFLGIRKYLEGAGELLEFLFRGLVPRVHVRVVLARELAIRLLDLRLARGARNPEDLVVIFRHGLEISK